MIIYFKVICENPLFNQSVGSSLHVVGYNEPAVIGTSVTFNCSDPGKILVGSNTATCMNDVQWKPRPNQLQMSCKGIMSALF